MGNFTVVKLLGPMPTPYGLEVDHDDNVWSCRDVY